MLAPVLKALTSRTAGPVATGFAVALALLLALSWTSAAQTQARLESRIADLSRQAHVPAVTSVAGRPAGLELARSDAQLPAAPVGAKDAERLLTVPPAGFDDCARMQSADEAVLSSLK
jgi:hypothetical protein